MTQNESEKKTSPGSGGKDDQSVSPGAAARNAGQSGDEIVYEGPLGAETPDDELDEFGSDEEDFDQSVPQPPPQKITLVSHEVPGPLTSQTVLPPSPDGGLPSQTPRTTYVPPPEHDAQMPDEEPLPPIWPALTPPDSPLWLGAHPKNWLSTRQEYTQPEEEAAPPQAQLMQQQVHRQDEQPQPMQHLQPMPPMPEQSPPAAPQAPGQQMQLLPQPALMPQIPPGPANAADAYATVGVGTSYANATDAATAAASADAADPT